MRILALETAAKAVSAAITEDGRILASGYQDTGLTHSRTLMPIVECLLRNTGLRVADLDAVAVSAGPGSFTGLRIGSASVKGLCFALKKPVIEIPTLEGLACNLYGTDKLVCPIMDARRNQVYTGIYEFIKREGMPVSYGLNCLLPQCAVPIEEIAGTCNKYGREVIFLGDGVPVFAQRLGELMEVPYGFAPAHMNRQRAAAFGFLAEEYYNQGRAVSGADHAPVYLRLSQAEREKREKA